EDAADDGAIESTSAPGGTTTEPVNGDSLAPEPGCEPEYGGAAGNGIAPDHLAVDGDTAGCDAIEHPDLADRRRMEEALRQSERDFRGLFETAHDAIIIMAPEGETVIEVNQRACDMYGLTREEFIGSSMEHISKDASS